MNNPRCVLLFSGKRKSGKDFITEELVKLLRPNVDCVVIKISAPIKSHFAAIYDLSLDDLMGCGEYKEKYRRDMISWSETERNKDPGIFCRAAVNMYEGCKRRVWLISDVRRKTDVAWFLAMYNNAVKTVRIHANEDTRAARGFVHTDGIDNVQSECDLDDYSDWDWTIDNSTNVDITASLLNIVEYINNVAS